MQISAGDTFLFDPDDGGNPHLWIVLKVYRDDCGGERVLLVNVTSWTPHGDKTCLLERGDHPFIGHKSYAYYGAMRDCEPSDLDEAPKHVPVSKPLLDRLLSGALKSPHTKRGMKQLLRCS